MAKPDPKFAAAFIDGGARHRILGILLKPYCLWHLYLLQVVDSPFLRAGVITVFDLKTAIGICRLTYPNSNVKRSWWPLWSTQKAHHKRVSRILSYFGDYIEKPDWYFIPSGKSSTPSRRGTPPPEPLAVGFDAAESMRITFPQAMELPIAQAYIAQAMNFRNKGANMDFAIDDEVEEKRKLDAAGFNWRHRN